MTDGMAFSGWDRIDATDDTAAFQSYLDTVTGLDRMQALKRRSHRLLAPTSGDTLLDVGCGTGDDVLALAELVGSEGIVIGVDNSVTMVRTARDRAPESSTDFRVADAEDLPFASDAIAGSRADRVLQHLDHPRRAFEELCRVTRPGGRVVVTDSDWGTLTVDTPTQPDLTARILDPDWSCAQNGRIGRQLRRWATEAGLIDLDIDTATLVLTDFETADEVLGLTGRIETMQAAGVLSDVDGHQWLQRLRRADTDGEFFSSLDIFTVAGTVPE